jgi:hypothetical protein
LEKEIINIILEVSLPMGKNDHHAGSIDEPCQKPNITRKNIRIQNGFAEETSEK